MGDACSKAPAPPGGMGNVKVYGVPASQNCVGPILLAMESGAGEMEMLDLMSGAQKTASFARINPSQTAPAIQDGEICSGESNAIMRYIAMKYAPQWYPVEDPNTCLKIDFAMDAYGSYVYGPHMDVVYVLFGFREKPTVPQAEANKLYADKIEKWFKDHVRGKFVTGDKLSIADFKVAPFMFSAIQPACNKKLGFKAPQRAVKYCDDFCAAVKASTFMKDAGGFSIAEFAASKAA